MAFLTSIFPNCDRDRNPKAKKSHFFQASIAQNSRHQVYTGFNQKKIYFKTIRGASMTQVKTKPQKLRSNPFTTYRDPKTGRWVVVKVRPAGT